MVSLMVLRPTAATLVGAREGADQAGVIGREAYRLWSQLDLFDRLKDLAERDPGRRDELEALAWDKISEADPIRVRHAQQILEVSAGTVTDWTRQGILEEEGSRPRRLSLASVLRTKGIVDELRELGQDQALVSVVLNRLELEELEQNDRFRESLEQMRRGERGEWPAGWAGAAPTSGRAG